MIPKIRFKQSENNLVFHYEVLPKINSEKSEEPKEKFIEKEDKKT